MKLAIALLLALTVGCGGRDGDEGGEDGDAALPGDDGAVPLPDAGPGADGGPGTDSGPRPDSGATPEECSGGVDEDLDRLTDCNDDDCWSLEACATEHVRRSHPAAVPCGDAVEQTTAETAAACASAEPPPGDGPPVECSNGTVLEATLRVYCTAGGEPVALWIDERSTTPRSVRMLTPRSFEHIYDDRSSIQDWERQVTGGGGFGGPVMPLLEAGRAAGPRPEEERHRTISVRPVEAHSSVTRFLGFTRITSLVDLDAGMSMDTRHNYHTGVVSFVVPAATPP